MAGLISLFFLQFNAWPTDSWTYLAAAERLNAGHHLYALEAGDRSIGPNGDRDSIPLLSPPLIAVVWRPLALLPPGLAVAAWEISALIAIATVIFAASRARPAFGLASALVFALPIAFLAVTGNVNCHLMAGMALSWILVRNGRQRLAGVVVALMAGIKLFPGVLLVWLLAWRRYRAVAWAALAGLVLLVVGIAGAGIESFVDYVDVVRSTATTGYSPFTLAALARSAGIPAEIASVFLLAALSVGLGATWIAGRRGDGEGSLVAAVFTAVWSSPVVNFDWLALLFAGLAPAFWPLPGRRGSESGAGRSAND